MEQHPIKINKVQIRNLQIEDYAQLSQSFTRVYSDGSDVFWTHAQIKKLISIFPEGQIVTVVDDKIVGCALSIIVDYDKVKNDHTYAQVTGKETSCTVLRCLFIRDTVVYVWLVVCMNIARSSAKH